MAAHVEGSRDQRAYDGHAIPLRGAAGGGDEARSGIARPREPTISRRSHDPAQSAAPVRPSIRSCADAEAALPGRGAGADRARAGCFSAGHRAAELSLDRRRADQRRNRCDLLIAVSALMVGAAGARKQTDLSQSGLVGALENCDRDRSGAVPKQSTSAGSGRAVKAAMRRSSQRFPGDDGPEAVRTSSGH